MKRIGIFSVIGILCAIIVNLTATAWAEKQDAGNLGVEVGNLAPEFTFQNEKGKWVSLSDYRGKKVFLFSWATWCRCREQLAALQEFYRKHKSEKFEVIAVASDSQGFKWVKPYLDNAGATYVALVDPSNELAVKYNFLATENGFLIDESGVIRMNEIGFDIRKDEQRKELEKVMKTDFGAGTREEKKTLDVKIKELEEGLSKFPKAFTKRLEISELYRVKGDYGKAEGALREAIGQNKKSAEAHYRLGVVLYQKGEVEEAVKEWEKAYKYESTNYLYMRNIEAYHDPGKFYSELEKK